MTKIRLSHIQLILLTNASQRKGHSLLPLPDSIAGDKQRARKAITALVKRGLAVEQPVIGQNAALRREGDQHIGVVATGAGLSLLDAPSDLAPPKQVERKPQQFAETAGQSSDAGATRAGTKQALVISMLRRDGGASLNELGSATGWLPHTTRAALTGLRKKGHIIGSAKIDGVTCYSIASA